MRSFKGTVIISKEYSQVSILSMALYIFPTLKFAVTQFCQRNFFQRILENREANVLSKQLYFQSVIDNTEMRSATHF